MLFASQTPLSLLSAARANYEIGSSTTHVPRFVGRPRVDISPEIFYFLVGDTTILATSR